MTNERSIEYMQKSLWVSGDIDVVDGLQLFSKPSENRLGIFSGFRILKPPSRDNLLHLSD